MSDWSGLSRRGFLRAGAIGVAGVAGAALIGCTGDAADDAATRAPAAATAAAATATAAAATAAPTATRPRRRPRPKSGGTLVWGMESGINPVDPQQANNWVSWRVKHQLGETLVAQDLTVLPVDGQQPVVNRLAESIEINDEGTEFTFKLRKGARFHDGTDVNAEAVRHNYDRMWNEDSDIFYAAISGWPHGRINQFLQSVEVIDDHTVKMVNSTPFVHFLELMTGYMFPAMVSTTQVEKLGNEEFANDPVATGPFQWNHEVKDVRTVMDRNEDYWDAAAGKGPFLDQIVWVPREEVAARVTSLQTGETDLIFIPPPDQIPQLLDQGFKISTGRPPHV